MGWVAGLLIFIISFEAMWWGWTLNRHGSWIARHPEMDRRKMVSPRMLKVACAMMSLLSLAVWLWWMYVNTASGAHIVEHSRLHEYACSFIVAGIQLTHIHFSAMVARYSCLPRSLWPMLSIWISKTLCFLFKIKPPPLTSCDVHRCWHDLARSTQEAKT